MKPLKLTMTAFGPYKEREVIEFTELDEHRLFVISGNTGAGKTTIFDAICFALYGEASGEERSDPRMLRSHFAEDHVHTSVELEFALHGRTYRIYRQMPHIKSGNKTATGDRYELYETTGGQERPCVDRFHVKDINEKIERLIGLTKDQFSQIVMLPQGEFRKLLTSETENKEEILRRIFKTGLYKRFAERLNEKRKEARQHYDKQTRERDIYIQNIPSSLPARPEAPLFQILAQEYANTHQILEGLETEIAHYVNEIEQNKNKQAEAVRAYQEKTAAYHRAKAVNETFQRYDEKRKKKAELDADVPRIKEKEQRLQQAEKASHLDVYEQHVREAKQEEAAKKTALQTAIAAEKTASETLASAQSIYEKEEARNKEREQLTRDIDRLNGFLPTVRDLDQKKAELSQLTSSQTKHTEEVAKLEETLQKEKERKQKLDQAIKQLEQGIMTLPQQQQRLTELRDQCTVLRDALRLQKDIEQREKDVSEKQQQYETAQQDYDRMEARWFEGQTSLIAARLHDGEPCPVCGSIEHPAKASAHGDVPTKETLDRLKKEKERKEQAYLGSRVRRDDLRKQLDEIEVTVREYGFPMDDLQTQYDRRVAEGKRLKKDVDTLLQNQETLKQSKTDHEYAEKKIEQITEKKEKLEKALQEQKMTYETRKALYEQALKDIPEDLRSLERLQRHLKETERRKQQFEQQWKDAQEQRQKAQEGLATAKANVTNARAQQSEATEKVNKAVRAFEDALQKAGFSDENAYKQARMPEADRHDLKKEIEAFHTERSNLASQIEELEKELQGQSRVDLETLSQEVARLEQAAEAARSALQSSETYKQEAEKLKRNLSIASEKVKEAEADLQTVTDLHDAVRGHNARKMSFERYLQIEFLEQIVHAANERLRRLSNGQFYLMRSDRLEKRGKQSGLGLDVYDAYTGQTRDVKSLSGGEKFNASLCLALGMADVIQAFEGGISIETMFIDEGFGALDEEALNKAIDTLIDLQKSGRMIGVISHVQELKNTIPAVLQVQKTKEGHSRTRFVLKS